MVSTGIKVPQERLESLDESSFGNSLEAKSEVTLALFEIVKPQFII
jgi:hypothetical protein